MSSTCFQMAVTNTQDLSVKFDDAAGSSMSAEPAANVVDLCSDLLQHPKKGQAQMVMPQEVS